MQNMARAASFLQWRCSTCYAATGAIAPTQLFQRNLPLRKLLKIYLPAVACSLILVLCYFVVRPYAEFGIADDWLYIKDALNVAITGRIFYAGGETPMLGWQLYFGALFIKLFGFSFTVVRLSTTVQAMATAFLLQRIGVRAGLNSWNAALVALIFVLSPLYFSYSLTFMSDISGVLCILVCVYMCLRAVEAGSERAAMVWVSVAALVNAVGGTVRQIAWLGLLVMVPCTLWLLKKSWRVLVAGGLSCIAGLVFILAALHWLKQQPYIIPVSPIPHRIDLDFLKNGGRVLLGGVGVLTMYALPVLLLFAGALRLWKRRLAAAALALLAIVPIHLLKIDKWPVIAAFNVITFHTVDRLNNLAVAAIHLAAARSSLRILLTGAVVFGLLCFVLFCLERAPARRLPPETPVPQQKCTAISWQKLGVMLGPFSAAYLFFVVMAFAIYDRYFLPLLAILLLVLVRFYQEKQKARLSWACILLIVLFAGFSLAATHDDFASSRGYVAAAAEIRSSGVPATAILGPQALEGWAELEKVGHLRYPPPVPKAASALEPGQGVPAHCDKGLYFLILLGITPSIQPAYAVSPNPQECGGQIAFPPVEFSTWIAPRTNSIYAVRLPNSISR
jgi:4-amino-4-deoxy-L-arabinose transferase-like glycosyltransferase